MINKLLFALLVFFNIGSFATEIPQLMLATVWKQGENPAGWWLSEKYDGVRGYWDGQQMLTRGGKTIVLPDSFRVALPPFPVDGELWRGYGRFEQTIATVLDQIPGEGWQHIRYLIFDAPAVSGSFEERMAAVTSWWQQNSSQQIYPIAQTRCYDNSQLQRMLDAIEARGGEGIMLRAANSPYQFGRSEYLRKLKRFDDAEAKVVGYNPGRGKYSGMVGSLLVQMEDGTLFSVGSGLSDHQRRTPPAIGSTITFKHYGWTKNGKPRFATFWRQRTQ